MSDRTLSRISKLDATARVKAAVVVPNSLPPSSDPRLLTYLGRKAKRPSTVPEVMRALRYLGRIPVTATTNTYRPMRFNSFDEAMADLRRLARPEPFTAREQRLFNAYARDHFVEVPAVQPANVLSDDHSDSPQTHSPQTQWVLNYPLPVVWTFIGWRTDGSEWEEQAGIKLSPKTSLPSGKQNSLRKSLHNLRDKLLQIRNDCLVKPGVLLHPDLVTRRWVHEREELGQVVAVVLDDLRERGRGLELQIALRRIGADQDRELQVGHKLQQARVPFIRKIFTRGQIATLPGAREVEVHGNNGQFPRVIEGIAIDAHPVAKAVTAAVVPDDAAFFGHAAGSLADDHDPAIGSSEEERVNTALCK